MTLPILVEDQENLPEGYESLYEEGDKGGYYLKVEGVDSHPEVQGLKTAYQKEKEKRQALAKQRDELKRKADVIPEDVELETVQGLIEKLQSGALRPDGTTEDPNRPDPAKIKAEIEKRYQQQLDELTEGLSKKEGQLQRMVIDNGLTGALSKNKVTDPYFQKAAKKLLADQVQVKEDDNGRPFAVVETDMGEVSLDQFVQNWAASDEGSRFVDGSTGGGTRSGHSQSPKGKRQVTRGQFQAMAPAEKNEFINKNGGTVVD